MLLHWPFLWWKDPGQVCWNTWLSRYFTLNLIDFQAHVSYWLRRSFQTYKIVMATSCMPRMSFIVHAWHTRVIRASYLYPTWLGVILWIGPCVPRDLAHIIFDLETFLGDLTHMTLASLHVNWFATPLHDPEVISNIIRLTWLCRACHTYLVLGRAHAATFGCLSLLAAECTRQPCQEAHC